MYNVTANGIERRSARWCVRVYDAISAKILVMGIVQVLALGLLLFMQPAPCPGSTAGSS